MGWRCPRLGGRGDLYRGYVAPASCRPSRIGVRGKRAFGSFLWGARAGSRSGETPARQPPGGRRYSSAMIDCTEICFGLSITSAKITRARPSLAGTTQPFHASSKSRGISCPATISDQIPPLALPCGYLARSAWRCSRRRWWRDCGISCGATAISERQKLLRTRLCKGLPGLSIPISAA